MKYLKKASSLSWVIILVNLFLFTSCKGSREERYEANLLSTEKSARSSNGFNDDTKANSSDGYEDGTYCATVTYYNSNTGRRSVYELTVEVENGKLVRMLFPNGGWLDESHFDPPAVDDDGTCSFISDKGYEYTVEINDSGECDDQFLSEDDSDNDSDVSSDDGNNDESTEEETSQDEDEDLRLN